MKYGSIASSTRGSTGSWRVVVEIDRSAHSCLSTGSQERERRSASRDVHRSVGNLLQRARRERREDAVLDLPERIATLHFMNCSHSSRLGRARRDRQRAVDRLDDVGHRDLRVGEPQAVAAARPLVRGQQAAAREALQHLGHQLDGNVVLLGDLARAGRRRHPAAWPGASSPSARSRLFWRVAAFAHHIPSCSFATSDIRSLVQPGSQTTSTFASVTPGDSSPCSPHPPAATAPPDNRAR